MCKSGGKLLIMLNIIFLLFFAASCAPTLVDRVEAFRSAVNNHDIEKTMSFYADDVRFELIGTPMVIEGKEQLRKPIEEQFILNDHLTFTDIKVNGNTVTYKVKEQNDMLKAAGIDALYYEYDQITFENGLIKQEKAKPTKESMRIMGEFQESLEKWASEKQGRKWAKLKDEGVTRENVSDWLAITHRWRKEVKQQKK